MRQIVSRRRKWLTAIERATLSLGVILLGTYVTARVHSVIISRAALHSLETPRGVSSATAPDAVSPTMPLAFPAAADVSLWSEKRIRAYQRSTIKRSGTPLAILRIPRLHMEVPVLEGTDRVALNAGVGRIAGTALPGNPGNIGIAGHRDSFFRELKSIAIGDTIELSTRQSTDTYVVDKTYITVPADASALRASARSELTLVTCYPFYFVGPAPKRFIVHASLKE